MSKNALALVDCNNRDQLFQFLVEAFDRKAVKNEMVSPYDEQLIGKMNFRYGGMEHAMFFTYARSSEYPGMRFRNHKIIYLSLGVNDISSAIFDQICARFGGFIDYNDDLDNGWQKIERQKVVVEDRPELAEEAEVAVDEDAPAAEQQKEIRQILKLERKQEQQEQEEEEQDNRPQEVAGKAVKVEKAEKPAKENRAPKEGNKEKDGAKEGKPERRDNNRRGNRRGGRRSGDRQRGQRPDGQKADNAKQEAARAERPKPERKQEKPIEPQKG